MLKEASRRVRPFSLSGLWSVPNSYGILYINIKVRSLHGAAVCSFCLYISKVKSLLIALLSQPVNSACGLWRLRRKMPGDSVENLDSVFLTLRSAVLNQSCIKPVRNARSACCYITEKDAIPYYYYFYHFFCRQIKTFVYSNFKNKIMKE